jgi:hypothetical protein
MAYWQRIIAGVVLCAVSGCATTATISRTDGWTYEADILDSDASSLHVRDVYGREVRVPREEVADIDHPGNLLLTFGLIAVAMSIPLIVGDLAQDKSQRTEWSGLGVVIGAGEAIAGLSLAIPGWVRYRHSTRAAKAFEDANPILPVPRPAVFYPYPYPYPAPYPYPPPPQGQ